MKLVVIAIIVTVVTASALEFKNTSPILPPVDGSIYNGSVWVVK